jgi:DNA-binding CsgD family transcriptional regulator
MNYHVARLTRRERQILDLAAQHLTSKQIGPRLGIQPASVDTFMQVIIRKLEVASRKDAVIAYLAERDRQGRDNHDFGLLSVEVAGDVASGRHVAAHGDLGISDPTSLAFRQSDREDDEAQSGGTGTANGRTALQARGFLGSPVRRLVAMAIATLILGVMTLAAVVLGYNLNQAVDRMFREPLVHHSGRSGRE